jgi:hypothetical protein
MPLGVDVTDRLAPPARGPLTSTGTLFVAIHVPNAGDAWSPQRGVLIRGMDDFVINALGPRVDFTEAYDYLDVFFREGGQRAWVTAYNPTAVAPGMTTAAEALATFTPDLGPGQVKVIGEPADAALVATLLAHAEANNRFALIDAASGDDSGARQALGAIARADDNVEHGMVFGRPLEVPAPSGTVGFGTRSVPLSAGAAALMNRADALGNPNRAAAGRDFPFQYAIGVWGAAANPAQTEAELETELNAGVNNAFLRYGVLQLEGFQTALVESEDNPFWQANPARARMWLRDQAKFAGEPYRFRNLDAKGRLLGGLKTDLEVLAADLYEANGLYGETAPEAYAVSVRADLISAAQARLTATIEARWSLHTKHVAIELVSVPVTGAVSAA